MDRSFQAYNNAQSNNIQKIVNINHVLHFTSQLNALGSTARRAANLLGDKSLIASTWTNSRISSAVFSFNLSSKVLETNMNMSSISR